MMTYILQLGCYVALHLEFALLGDGSSLLGDAILRGGGGSLLGDAILRGGGGSSLHDLLHAGNVSGSGPAS